MGGRVGKGRRRERGKGRRIGIQVREVGREKRGKRDRERRQK